MNERDERDIREAGREVAPPPSIENEDKEWEATLSDGLEKEDPYSHWNEEAPIVKYKENRDAYESGSPLADMTDAEIKQHIYDTWDEDE